MDLASLAASLTRLGAPILGGALGGPAGAAIASTVVESLAKALDVEPTPEAVGAALEKPDAPIVVRRVEAAEAPAVIEAVNQYMEIVRQEGEKGWFWNAWRPAGMWAVLAMWLWALVPAPLLRLPLDMGSLTAFTTLYLTLYMGGHTAKEWFSQHYAGKGRGK